CLEEPVTGDVPVKPDSVLPLARIRQPLRRLFELGPRLRRLARIQTGFPKQVRVVVQDRRAYGKGERRNLAAESSQAAHRLREVPAVELSVPVDELLQWNDGRVLGKIAGVRESVKG